MKILSLFCRLQKYQQM